MNTEQDETPLSMEDIENFLYEPEDEPLMANNPSPVSDPQVESADVDDQWSIMNLHDLVTVVKSIFNNRRVNHFLLDDRLPFLRVLRWYNRVSKFSAKARNLLRDTRTESEKDRKQELVDREIAPQRLSEFLTIVDHIMDTMITHRATFTEQYEDCGVRCNHLSVDNFSGLYSRLKTGKKEIAKEILSLMYHVCQQACEPEGVTKVRQQLNE